MTTDPRTQHVIAQLDQFADLYPALLRTLAARRTYAHRLVADLGLTPEDWASMSIEERDAIQVRHADVVPPLVMKHHGIRRAEWRELDWDKKQDLIDAWRDAGGSAS